MFFLIGFSIFIFIIAIGSFLTRNILEERLNQIKHRENLKVQLMNFVRRVGEYLVTFPVLDEIISIDILQSKLRIAGFKIKATEFIGIWGLSILTSLFLAFLLRPFLPIIILPFIVLIGIVVPKGYLDHKYHRRKLLFRREFIDFVERMQVGLSGGIGFMKVLEWSAKTKMLFNHEIKQVLQDVKLGDTLEGSFDKMAKRMKDNEIDAFVTTIKYSARNGTLGEASSLSSLVADMRRKRNDLIDENARKAEVKLILPIVFTIFPATAILVAGPMVIFAAKVFFGPG